MNSPVNKLDSAKSLLSVQTIVIAAIAWGVLALLFFLLFSVPLEGADGVPKRAYWYLIGTYIFEELAYLAAASLCLRNWRSSNIVSGKNVWLGFGIGMLSYFIGNLLLGYWELGLHIEPTVSPGDFFFIITYLALGCSMIFTVRSRRLNLENWQWVVVTTIGGIGILLAWLISGQTFSFQKSSVPSTFSVAEQVVFTTPSTLATVPVAPPIATATLKKTVKVNPTKPSSTQSASSSDQDSQEESPAWATALEEQLKPLGSIVNFLYVIFDIFLLILATMLLLAFWGGRFSQSWRMIAAAVFSLYIADMWLKYANTYIEHYQSGALLEVFWVFSGVLFAIGAALEFDISSRSRRTTGRKRA